MHGRFKKRFFLFLFFLLSEMRILRIWCNILIFLLYELQTSQNEIARLNLDFINKINF